MDGVATRPYQRSSCEIAYERLDQYVCDVIRATHAPDTVCRRRLADALLTWAALEDEEGPSSTWEGSSCPKHDEQGVVRLSRHLRKAITTGPELTRDHRAQLAARVLEWV